jgi:RNA polymerase sigma-70 factor (ECF subfamily)
MGSALRATASAEDILQHACEKAFRGIRHFRPGDDAQASMKAWFHTILDRAIVDAARRNLGAARKKHKGMQRLESELLLVRRSGDPTPSLAAAKKEAKLAIEAAIQQLARTARTIIELYYWGGLSVAEIATHVELTPSAVAVRLVRARRRLRSILGASSAYFLPPRKRTSNGTEKDHA